jgi:hypothetical protein
MLHRHVDSGTENPLSTGPSAGPPYAKTAQQDRAYGTLLNGKRSCAEAAPVDSTGPPKNPDHVKRRTPDVSVVSLALPWMNLITTKPGKLFTLDPIAVITMKMRNEDM